jgi:beta-lactam-binding protein with PASTA domain
VTTTTTSTPPAAAITVPPVAGKGLYVAESILATHGLTTGQVIIDRDSRGEAGTISKSIPGAGATVPANHPIDLYVIPPS